MTSKPTWIQAVLDWAKEERPAEYHSLKSIVEMEEGGDIGKRQVFDATIFMMHVGFEAGRKVSTR